MDQPTKRVSKKHFANEETKQKALEWTDSSSTNVACDLEELDPPPIDKPSYKSAYCINKPSNLLLKMSGILRS